MHEQTKFMEAEYFLAQMINEKGNLNPFKYNLSAFLSAARSVLQYSREEVRVKDGGQGWYDNQTGVYPTIKFFKDKRDINVHGHPVPLKQNVNITVTGVIGISDFLAVTIKDQNGNIIGRSESAPNPPQNPQVIPAITGYEYFFHDWNGKEDVIELCRKYLEELKLFLADGRSKGFMPAS